MSDDETPQPAPPPVRGTVELPQVVLSDEYARPAPPERVLPGLIHLRWLAFPAYVTCLLAAVLAVSFAMESGEWAAGPVALAWGLLLFWQWLYGIGYHYRRSILKYFAIVLVWGLAGLLVLLCLERAEAQWVIAGGKLVERDAVPALRATAVLTLASAALPSIHALALGRGYRRVKTDAKTAE